MPRLEVAPGALPIEEAPSEADYDADEKSAPDSADATSDTSSSSGSAIQLYLKPRGLGSLRKSTW